MRSVEEQSRILKAIAHPNRMEIIRRLKKDGCNVSAIQEALDLPQSTISHHLLVLKNAGILSSRREGTKVCYTIELGEIVDILAILAGT